jgi:hypothetical protein
MYQEGFLLKGDPMAATLEATLVIPITMAVTIGLLSASIYLYGRIERDAGVEADSFLYAMEHQEMWSCEVKESASKDFNGTFWSKRIAVNPIKEKNLLMYIYDTVREIKEILPIAREMEGLFFDEEK